jgi:hypothetical protein
MEDHVLTAALIALLFQESSVTDTARIQVKIVPADGAPSIEWVSLSERDARPLDRGTGPTDVFQVANGTGVTYCAREIGRWLKLVAVSTTGTEITASGACTTVTATARGGISTRGIRDPRVPASGPPARQPAAPTP